jgi:hypothetical protein
MGRDIWGHTYFDANGKRYQGKSDKPQDWVIGYKFIENDGWSFVNRGSERKVEIIYNSKCSTTEVKRIIKKCIEDRIVIDEEVIPKLNSLFDYLNENP